MQHMDFATGKLTVTDSIYNKLLLDISKGVYKEGDKLPSESTLCKENKASRISVRSALQRLEAIGLIETFQGRGSFLKAQKPERLELNSYDEIVETLPDGTISMDEFVQYWHFRQALNRKAMELFVLKATKEDFDNLREIVKRMGETEDFDKVSLLTVDFYMYIYLNCGSKYIANAFANVIEVTKVAFRTIQKENFQTKENLVRWNEKVLEYLIEGEIDPILITITEENLKLIHRVNKM